MEDLAACRAESVASDTKHMVAYLNTHVALENRRNKAAAAAAIALANGQPLGGTVNIAIVGERDVGKTTVARLLTAYALKGGRKPLFVDLDPSAGTLALATSIGAVVVDRMDVTETTGISITASPPLLYSFGHESPRENVGAYRKILDKLASMCIRRLEKEQTVRDSGMIIDTHAWNEATGTDDLLHLVDAFRVDVVLVVGSDAVFGEVNRVFADQGRTAAVVKLPKSGGVRCMSRRVPARNRFLTPFLNLSNSHSSVRRPRQDVPPSNANPTHS